MVMSTKGLKPKDRKLARTGKKKLTGNQWQNTPQQHEFMQAWLDPESPTFGNAYKSAIQVKYSPFYATQLSSPSVNNKWIQEYTKKLLLTDEHLKQGIQQIAISSKDSRSPDDTRLKAYEILSRISGLLNENRGSLQVTVVQPILGGQSVKPVESEVIEQ